MISHHTLLHLLPEIILVATATAIFVAGAFVKNRGVWSWFAAAGILGAVVALYGGGAPIGNATGDATGTVAPQLGPVAHDLLGFYLRALSLWLGMLFVLLMTGTTSREQSPEVFGSLLLILAGLALAAGSNELVLLFLGLELVSIPTYVLLYLGRRDAASQESAAKYFFLSLLASALFLYGLSFLYGVSGSTRLDEIRTAIAAADTSGGLGPLVPVALVLIFAGLGFRLTAVPFHFYAPDVYQGTSNPNAGLLSVAPKIAGLVALVRLVAIAMPGWEDTGWRIALVLSILTMTVGNVVALWQDNLRRLMAYSSIAHAGYILIGLAVGLATAGDRGPQSFDGIAAALLYLAVYSLATTGLFAALAYLGRDGREIDSVDELAGIGRTHPMAAAAIATCLFSLAGVPPLAGFWGKLSLFGGTLAVDPAEGISPRQGWFIALAAIGVLNAAVAAAYYLRIVGTIYFRPPADERRTAGGFGPKIAMVAAAAAVLVIGVYPGPMFNAWRAASRAALSEPAEVLTGLPSPLAGEGLGVSGP